MAACPLSSDSTRPAPPELPFSSITSLGPAPDSSPRLDDVVVESKDPADSLLLTCPSLFRSAGLPTQLLTVLSLALLLLTPVRIHLLTFHPLTSRYIIDPQRGTGDFPGPRDVELLLVERQLDHCGLFNLVRFLKLGLSFFLPGRALPGH